MREMENICLIDPTWTLSDAFERLGYNVLTLSASPAPFFSLPDALAEHGFTPDLVVQREVLGQRSLVLGLDTIECPTIFWAVDPHLNAYWHSSYARLFDVTCSTQKAWVGRVKARGAQDVRWLPMYARPRKWTEMADREHDLAFVGRITAQRPSRKRMVELIGERFGEYDLAVAQDLDLEAMMQLYMDAKIIPNEAIFGEVNFRLFEATACGCLVLGQDVGEEQEELFEPGREMDTFSDVLEFEEKLAKYLKNDRLIQAMGMAAHKRVQAEHLPEHRAQTIVEIGKECQRNRTSGTEHAKWLTLTACAMCEAGLYDEKIGDVLVRLAALPQDADVAEAALRILYMAGMRGVVEENLNTILAGGLYADSPSLNLAGSMAALRYDNWDCAKAFWYRHLQSSTVKTPAPPNCPTDLLTLWGKEMKRLGVIIRAGFSFNAEVHLPTNAAECLMSILLEDHEHLPTLRLLEGMLRPIAGTDEMRVGLLSILTLHEREDWRLALEIALVNLTSFRRQSGLEELRVALIIARSQGQEAIFRKALAARDKSGLLSQALYKE